VREFTKCVLKEDHGLLLDLPADVLCPMVTVRLNYVKWVEQLVASVIAPSTSTSATDAGPRGIDVGTGASAIYLLLCLSRNATWTMAGSDVSAYGLQWAQRNVDANGLTARVRLVAVDGASVLTEVVDKDSNGQDGHGGRQYAFVMCNPPFYEDRAEMDRLKDDKRLPPNSAFTGSANEIGTPGGEVAFVKRMVAESALPRLRNRVAWFTSKLGIKASVAAIEEALRAVEGVKGVCTTVFEQGKTRRWGIAWSFTQTVPTRLSVRN